jgi:hypothetical protein
MEQSKTIKNLTKILHKNAAYLIVLVPIFTYWIFWNIYKTYWTNTDPSAWYFIDSLSVFAGGSYKFVDHPGTPVQIIGSLLLGLTLPFFGRQQDFINFHIAKPEVFYIMTNLFLVMFNGLTAALLYKLAKEQITFQPTLAGIAIALCYFAINPLSIKMLTYWQHNALYFPLGTLWWVLLYKKMADGEFSNKDGLIFGITAGIFANIQVFFIPFIFSSIIISFLYTWQHAQSLKKCFISGGYAILGNLIGIIAMIIPIYREFPRFFGWLKQIAFSENLYGDNAESFFTINSLLISIEEWRTENLIIILFSILMIAGCCVGLFYRQKYDIKLPSHFPPLLITLSIHIFVLVILLTKAYARPRFTLSLAAILPIVSLLTLQLLEMMKIKLKKTKQLVYLILIIGAFLTTRSEVLNQHEKHTLEVDLAASRSTVVKSFAQKQNTKQSDIVIVYAYGTPLKCASLLLANDWLGSFDREISALCPNQYSFYTDGILIELNSTRPLTNIADIEWDIVVSSGEPKFLSLLDTDAMTNVPGKWGATRGTWFFIKK